MQSKRFESMTELEHHIEALEVELLKHKKNDYAIIPQLFFRGQSNSTWKLTSTLERQTSQVFSVRDFNNKLCATVPAASSFTSQKWEIKHNPDLSEDINTSSLPNYEYMVHARHNGFPTPIIDWTKSLYIALFFAYHGAEVDKDVAVFAYKETLNGWKTSFIGSPTISSTGPYIKTHRRHFMQQAQYTFACKKDENQQWVYCSHSEVFDQKSSEQDLLFKFILPGNIRKSVLSKLDSMNINSYTLYGSEDSLFDMLAFRELLKDL